MTLLCWRDVLSLTCCLALSSPLYDPENPPRADLTSAAYKSSANSSTINHFHEKLLKLKDLMKTKAGRARALKRHQVMLDFLRTFEEECEGRA